MNFKHLLTMAACALPVAALAIPATPEPVVVTNPDGTTLTLRMHGDEHFNYATDINNTRVMARDTKGFWNPVVLNGKQLTTATADINALRADYDAKFFNAKAVNDSRKRMAAIADNGRTTYNTLGTVHGLVILVEFSDVSFIDGENARQSYDDLCNKPGYDAYGSNGSAGDYFRAISNGKFTPVFDVVGPVKLPNTQAYYSSQAQVGYVSNRDHTFELICDAVKALDPDVDFSQYDLDDDGVVDNIFVYFAGKGMADTYDSNFIWPHQGDLRNYAAYGFCENQEPDGVMIGTYVVANEVRSGSIPPGASRPWRDGIGTFCHEYGHVLGLPDFYDTANANQGLESSIVTPGEWDIMDKGSYNNRSTTPPGYSAYERWFCHWLEYTDVEDGSQYEVSYLNFDENGNNTAFRIPVMRSEQNETSEYFLVESRLRHGWDEYLPDNGVLIWHVTFDKKAWGNNTPNVDSSKESHAYYELIPSYVSGNTRHYVWPHTMPDVDFNTPDSPTALRPNYGRPYNFYPYLTSFKYDEYTGTGSFKYNVITSTPTDKTTLNTITRHDTNREINISWQPVEGATDYQLTVYRTDELGNIKYVNGWNELKTDGRTAISIPSISAAAWDCKFTVYVRVVKEIASSEISDKAEFFPADLVTVSGVESIADDNFGIFGSYGTIVCPEGAEIFNLSGTAVANGNLPAGIYLVRFNNKTVKVLVK